MRQLPVILAFAVLLLGLACAPLAASPAGSIDEVIDREMPRAGVPGMAYVVVIDAEIDTVGARGLMRMGDDREVTVDAPFPLASLSKSFTAVAILQLVEAGQVDLDRALANYLEAFVDRPAGAITIRQLLSHTSGFSTLQGNTSSPDESERGDELERSDELARAVDRFARVAPAADPETTWDYSNANYQILGRVVEVVSGQSYQDYVEARIMAPLGMTHSFVADGAIHDEMATGHQPWFGTKRPRLPNQTDRRSAPQGGVVASAGDMGLYLRALLNGEDDILSAESKALMMQPASAASPAYGFGWHLDPAGGDVWHAGLAPGYETLAILVPAERRAVVVLTNANGGVGFGELWPLLDGVSARGLGRDPSGVDGRWAQKALFVGLVLAPLVCLLGAVWAWWDREGVRAKSDGFGRFSLWFPLFTTLGVAGVVFLVVPRLFGVPLLVLGLYQPDLTLLLVASGIAAPAWALFRLGIAYSGQSTVAGASRGRTPTPAGPST